MCYGIGLNSMMMNPMLMSGGCMGMYGMMPNSIWGYGGGCCGDAFSTKPLMFGAGVGIGYTLSQVVVAGAPKFFDWVGGLFSKKGKESQAA